MSNMEVNKAGSDCGCTLNNNNAAGSGRRDRTFKKAKEEFASDFDVNNYLNQEGNHSKDKSSRNYNSNNNLEQTVSERSAWN